MNLSVGEGWRRAGLAVAHLVGLRSMQVVHVLGARDGGGAAGAVAAPIEAFRAPERRAERRPRPRLGAPDRARRRLPTELRTERLRRDRSGVRVSVRLAHRLLELRDRRTAWPGL